jgi:hypothetical protein
MAEAEICNYCFGVGISCPVRFPGVALALTPGCDV